MRRLAHAGDSSSSSNGLFTDPSFGHTDTQIQQVRPTVANVVYEAIVGPPRPLLPGSPAAE